jgi:hypothetical protein
MSAPRSIGSQTASARTWMGLRSAMTVTGIDAHSSVRLSTAEPHPLIPAPQIEQDERGPRRAQVLEGLSPFEASATE